MQKNKQIKSLFFLGVFSLILLHQVFPHLHHQHDEKSEIIVQAEEHHHNHQHDIPEKEDNSKKDFVDLFLGMHTHIHVIDEIPIIRNSIKHQNGDDNFALKIPLSNFFEFGMEYKEVEKPTIYNPPNNYFNLDINNVDLRGPPVLA
jgi:hypothetical protein